MTANESTLAARAESAIRRLRDVEGVSVRVEGNEIREIHVVTRSERHGKLISRDVQTVLRVALGVDIDHRVVSVAPLSESPATVAVALEEPVGPQVCTIIFYNN